MYATPSLNGHALNGHSLPHGPRFAPSPNGCNGGEAPSPNGCNGHGAPSPNGGNGQDARGRFTKGNKGGPGNPFNRRVARLRTLLLEIVTEEDLRGVLRKLVERAREGDVASARLLLTYLIGRPVDAVDPDRVDLDEWRLLQECPGVSELVPGYQHRIDLGFASALATTMQQDQQVKIIETIQAARRPEKEEQTREDLSRSKEQADGKPSRAARPRSRSTRSARPTEVGQQPARDLGLPLVQERSADGAGAEVGHGLVAAESVDRPVEDAVVSGVDGAGDGQEKLGVVGDPLEQGADVGKVRAVVRVDDAQRTKQQASSPEAELPHKARAIQANPHSATYPLDPELRSSAPAAPSPNGGNGGGEPSATGCIGKRPPSASG
jgi:hypothetical protein